MAEVDDEDLAMEALARIQGISLKDLKRQLLQQALGTPVAAPAPREAEEDRALARISFDASRASRSEAITAHRGQAFPGSAVVRYDDSHETAAEAEARWLAEEAEDPQGVYGMGGSSAGGIFGSGPIATHDYDPEAHARGDQRQSQQANVRMLNILTHLEERFGLTQGGGGARGELPGRAPPRLPPRSRK